jgi:hypothetical protein
MLNDFQVSPDGGTVYIADASPVRGRPAILVHDVAANTTRRVLDSHRSVTTEDYVIQAPGRDMRLLFGLITLRIGVDSIALARDGTWLSYGPVTGGTLWRVPTAALRDPTLDAAALGERVEAFAEKTISDGMSSDAQGRLYLTDPEHSAIVAVGPDRHLHTVVKDPRLRWPDGLSFGPDGWLYVTCSALEDVLFRGRGAVAAPRLDDRRRFGHVTKRWTGNDAAMGRPACLRATPRPASWMPRNSNSRSTATPGLPRGPSRAAPACRSARSTTISAPSRLSGTRPSSATATAFARPCCVT